MLRPVPLRSASAPRPAPSTCFKLTAPSLLVAKERRIGSEGALTPARLARMAKSPTGPVRPARLARMAKSPTGPVRPARLARMAKSPTGPVTGSYTCAPGRFLRRRGVRALCAQVRYTIVQNCVLHVSWMYLLQLCIHYIQRQYWLRVLRIYF